MASHPPTSSNTAHHNPLPPGRSPVTPPTKYCAPEDVGKAPRKKDTKIVVTPGELGVIRINDKTKGNSEPELVNNEADMEPILENIIKIMQHVEEVLQQPTIRKDQKENARNKMAWAITHAKAIDEDIKSIQAQEGKPPINENTCLEKVLAELGEIKRAVKQTYSQAAQKAMTKTANPSAPALKTHHTCSTDHKCEADHEHAIAQQEDYEQDKARIAQAKKDVILSICEANDDAKEKCNMEEIVKKNLQKIIEQCENTIAVKIKNVKKLAKYIVRIRCDSEHDGTLLRQMNWMNILGGSTMMEAEYGIVIHGIPKEIMEDVEKLSERIKKDLKIKVKRIIPLTKKARNPDAPTLLIIIFTESPEDANKCIDNSAFIAGRSRAAQRYLPQCKIKQCYNCQAYGHKADICKRKPKCGKCNMKPENALMKK